MRLNGLTMRLDRPRARVAKRFIEIDLPTLASVTTSAAVPSYQGSTVITSGRPVVAAASWKEVCTRPVSGLIASISASV